MHLLRSVKQCYRAIEGKIAVSTDILFFLAIALLLVPLQWLMAWILAITIHELFHYLALRISGASVMHIRISCKGVVMDTDALPLWREAFCAYAGPVGALIILFFSSYLPRTAICTLVFSAYNLLPVFPLDGGRGLACIIKNVLPERLAVPILLAIENIVLASIVIISLYSVFKLGLGLVPAGLALILLVRSKGIKFPCKKQLLGVQ